MIPRYSTPEMDAVWSDPVRFGRWLEVELIATEGNAENGLVPLEAAAICPATEPTSDYAFFERILER